MNSFTCKTAVKDSFEEEDGSDDVEDEVFIRDGRTTYRIDDDIGLKRPLMAPRRKCKQLSSSSKDVCKRRCFCSNICNPYCQISMALFILISVILITITILDFPSSIERLMTWTLGGNKPNYIIIPSTQFSSRRIWMKSFPDLRSEDSLTLAKLNSDDFEDVVIGYSAGKGVECGGRRCLGGVLALDGKTGQILWQYWTKQEVLFVDCSSNVNQEATHDCLLSGKAGVLCIVDGRSGLPIWDSCNQHQPSASVYSAQYIPDMNGDGFPDILASHTLAYSSNLSVLSGRNGLILGHIETQDGPLITLPRLVTAEDESLFVLFATGSLNTPGSLFSIPLYSLTHSDISKCMRVWSGESGVSSDLVLVDMNRDQYEDIVLTSADKIIILNGRNYSQIWNSSLSTDSSPPSHILVGPTPAYFDYDKIPDLLVTKLCGPSYPNFYYSETQVFSGKDGSKLLEDSLIGSGDITGEGISVSFTGPGNDMYLYWLTTCHQDVKHQTKPFSLPPGLSLERADPCRLRFNTSLESRLYLLSDHIEPPGYLLYSSDKSWEDEHQGMTTQSPLPQSQQPYPPLDTQPVDVGTGGEPEEEETVINPWETADYPVDRASPNMKDTPYDPQFYIQDTVPMSADYYDKLVKPFDERREDVRVRTKRSARHDSIPRSSTTPVLVPSLVGEGVDVIFASHWIGSSFQNEKCIQEKTAEQAEGLSDFDLDLMRQQAERQCRDSEMMESPSSRLTVYRVSIEPQCYELNPATEKCSHPFPSYSQSFSHRSTNQYFKQRNTDM